MLPKISIVTPSFNQGKYLERTIRSVIEQGYPNLEYIIIDGGSTDNSIEVIKKYESKIDYWVSEKDNGQTDALIKGLSRCSGRILGWLNSDDELCSGALNEVSRQFLSSKEIHVVHGDSHAIDQDGKYIKRSESRKFRLLETLEKNRMPQPSVFFSKESYDVVGLDETRQCTMDHKLWLGICGHFGEKSFYYKNEVFSKMRYHEETKTSSLSLLFLEERIENLKIFPHQFPNVVSFKNIAKISVRLEMMFEIKSLINNPNIALSSNLHLLKDKIDQKDMFTIATFISSTTKKDLTLACANLKGRFSKSSANKNSKLITLAELIYLIGVRKGKIAYNPIQVIKSIRTLLYQAFSIRTLKLSIGTLFKKSV